MDYSLSSLSANPSMDTLDDGSDGAANDVANAIAAAANLGSHIADAVSGAPSAPAPVYYSPTPAPSTCGGGLGSPCGSGHLLLVVGVIVVIAAVLWSMAD